MALPCRDIPHGILVITVFIIVFTVVVNGMSMRILMNRLRLTELTDERRFMLKLAYEKLEKSSKAYFEAQKKKKPVVFRDIKWEQVQPYQISAPPDFKADEVADEGKSAWLEVLNIERSSYKMQFEKGTLGSEAFAKLETFMAELVADAGKEVAPPSFFRAASRMANMCRGSTHRASMNREKSISPNRAKLEAMHARIEQKKAKALAALEEALGKLKAEVDEKHARRHKHGAKHGRPNRSRSKHEEDHAHHDEHDEHDEHDADTKHDLEMSRKVHQRELARGDGSISMAQQLSDLYDWRFYQLVLHLIRVNRPWQLKVSYEVGLAYITAVHEVDHASKGAGADRNVFAMVAAEHEDNKRMMIQALTLIQRRLPGLIHEYKRTHVAGLLLHHQQDQIRELTHHGQLIDLDSSALQGNVNQMLKRLYLEPLKARMRQVSQKMPTHYMIDPAAQVLRKCQSMHINLGLLPRRQSSNHHLRPAAQAIIAAHNANHFNEPDAPQMYHDHRNHSITHGLAVHPSHGALPQAAPGSSPACTRLSEAVTEMTSHVPGSRKAASVAPDPMTLVPVASEAYATPDSPACDSIAEVTERQRAEEAVMG